LVQPITPKLSLRPDATSTNAIPMVITANPAINQTINAHTTLLAEFCKTFFERRKTPTPIAEPITIRIAEKKPIFFLGLEVTTNCSSAIRNPFLYIKINKIRTLDTPTYN